MALSAAQNDAAEFDPRINVEVLDHLRLVSMFADQFGSDFVRDAVNKTSSDLKGIVNEALDEQDAQPPARQKLAKDAFVDEIAWMSYALSESLEIHIRNLAMVSLYNEDHRFRLPFVMRPILSHFEPSNEIAKFLRIPPSSLSRWLSGKARPQRVVRETVKERLVDLVERTIVTLTEFNALLSLLLSAVQIDRAQLETSCREQLEHEVSKLKGSDRNVLSFG